MPQTWGRLTDISKYLWNASCISYVNYCSSKSDAGDTAILMTNDLRSLGRLSKAYGDKCANVWRVVYLWQGVGEISWWEEGLGQMCRVRGQEWGKLLLMLWWCWEYIWDTDLVASLHFLHLWFLYRESCIIHVPIIKYISKLLHPLLFEGLIESKGDVKDITREGNWGWMVIPLSVWLLRN